MEREGYEGLIEGFFSLPAELLTAISTVIGFALLGNLTSNQQNSLGYVFELIGEILQTNANQRFLLEAEAQQKVLDCMQRQIDELRRRIDGCGNAGQ